MIKSTLTKAEYREIYDALDRVSPLDTDCGELCGGGRFPSAGDKCVSFPMISKKFCNFAKKT